MEVFISPSRNEIKDLNMEVIYLPVAFPFKSLPHCFSSKKTEEIEIIPYRLNNYDPVFWI
jgi:hypothetical protein